MDRFEAPCVSEPFTIGKSGGPTIGPGADLRCVYGRRSIGGARRSGRVGADWPKIGLGSRFQSRWEPIIWKETMRSFQVRGQTVATALVAFGVGMVVSPTAFADPTGPDQPQLPAPVDGTLPEAPAAPGVAPDAAAVPGATIGPTGTTQGTDPGASPLLNSGDPTRDACDLFNKAVNYAAINYEDFADYSAGSGNYVNYADQTVDNANLAGRTALKQAAGAALNASGIPGAAPEATAPMRTWSLNAAKLVLVMGVRGGGDTLNSTATDMNTSAHQAQMACATAQTSS
jgi:hypothetical protein